MTRQTIRILARSDVAAASELSARLTPLQSRYDVTVSSVDGGDILEAITREGADLVLTPCPHHGDPVALPVDVPLIVVCDTECDATSLLDRGAADLVASQEELPLAIARTFRQSQSLRRISEQVISLESDSRHLAAAIDGVGWVRTPQGGRVLHLSDFRERFGWPAEGVELTLELYRANIHPDDLERVDREVQQSIDSGADAFSVDYRLRRSDDSYAYVRDAGRVIRENGKVVRIVGIARDVSAERDAMQALERSEERFRGIIDSTHDAIIVADDEARILSWNRAATRMFGYPREEALEQTVAMLLPPRLSSAYAAALQDAREGTAQSLVNRTTRTTAIDRDGREFPVDFSLTSWGSRERFFTAVIRDATAAAAEQTKREIAAAAHQAVGSATTLEEALERLCADVTKRLRVPYAAAWIPHNGGFERVTVSDRSNVSAGSIRVEEGAIAECAAETVVKVVPRSDCAHVTSGDTVVVAPVVASGTVVAVLEVATTSRDVTGHVDVYAREAAQPLRRVATEQQLRHMVKMQEIAAAVSTLFATTAAPQLEAQIGTALEIIGSFLCGDALRLLMPREYNGNQLRVAHEWRRSSGVVVPDPAAYAEWARRGFVPTVLVTPSDIITPPGEVRSLYALPLSIRRATAVLEFTSSRELPLGQRDILLLRFLADLLASAFVRRDAVNELLKQQSMMRAAERLGGFGSWEYDLRSGAITMSPGAYRVVGVPPGSDISYDDSVQLIHPEDRDHVLAAVAEVLERDVTTLECRLVTTDGRTVHVMGRLAPLRDDDGRPIGVIGAVRDVTERRKVYDELAQQRQFLEALLENVGEAIIACDAEGNLTFLNRAARAYRPHGPVQREDWLTYQELHYSDGSTRMPLEDVPLYRALQGEHVVGAEVLTRRAEDGEMRSLLVNGQPLYDLSGTKVGAFVVMHDYTDEQRALHRVEALHHRTQLIMNSVTEAICATDWKGIIVTANRAAVAYYGASESEYLGRSKHDLVHHTRRDGSPYPWEECPAYLTLRDGQERRVKNDIYWRADGTPRDVDTVYAPVIDEGEIVGTVVISNDVTEQRNAERRLEQASRLAGLGKLAASVAHEFNNVLMAIQPFAEILSNSATEARSRAAADHIINAVSRGKRITKDILRFARPAEPTTDTFEMKELLNQVAHESEPLLGAGIELRLLLPAEAIHLAADRQQLHQALINLILNARDAISGQGTISIEAERSAERSVYPFGRVADPQRFVHLIVRDTGRGMSQEVMQHMFEPLFTTKHGGTGLGLAIVHQIVSANGGVVFAESTPGVGTAMHLFVPVADARASGSPRQRPQPVTLGAACKVLLVEDDVDVAAGISALIEAEGFAVTVASRGAEVESSIESTNPDVVVLDVGLPDISGTEVFERIQSRWPELPVIFSTGHGDETTLVRYMTNDRVAMLLKPYDGQTLARKIRDVVTAGAR